MRKERKKIKKKKETMAAAMKASAMSARALFKKGAPAKKGTQPTKKKFSFGGSGKPQVRIYENQSITITRLLRRSDNENEK